MLTNDHTLSKSTLLKLNTVLFPELSKREFLCYYWSVLGFSRKEISELTGSNESTTNTHMLRITQKLNCKKFRQTIALYHYRMRHKEWVDWRLTQH